ncbi:hypothetical protein ACROYT_G035704 [Oculina patagonica]
MFVHCDYIANQLLDASNSFQRVIIFSQDTDVAFLCWYHFSQLSVQQLWFHTDTGRNRRFIPVHDAVEKNLGRDCAVISDETVTVCFNFIGLLYGEATSNLNHLRYKLFTKKHLDSSKLPPTEDGALYHVKRANYQCFIWKQARERSLSLTSPDGNGWIKDENGDLIPKLMEEDPAPESFLELIVCRCMKRCNARCSCRKFGSPVRPLALVKKNAATSVKMKKRRIFNPV